MNEALKFIHTSHAGEPVRTEDFGPEVARKVRDYHRSFPEYDLTPLVSLDNLAEQVGVGAIFVKAEKKNGERERDLTTGTKPVWSEAAHREAGGF